MPEVHVATVGRTPEPIVHGFRHHSVDRQVLLHSAETVGVAQEIRRRIEDLVGGRVCELVEIDPFDLRDIVAKVVEVRGRYPDADVRVNITGGTNVMASAALVACFMIGAHAYYVKENVDARPGALADSVVVLPVPQVRLESLNESQRTILRSLRKHGGILRRANVSLRQALDDASAQLVSYHLKKLRAKGLLELHVEGREKVATLTDAGRLFAELLS